MTATSPSASRPYRLGVGSLNLLIRYAAEQGVPARQCLAGTGLDVAMLSDPLAEIEPAQELQVIWTLIDALGDPFAHGFDVGLRYHLTAYGIWGLGIMSSATVAEAAERGLRYAGAAFTFINYRINAGPDAIWLEMDHAHLPDGLCEFLIARDLGSIFAIHQELLPGTPINVREVFLRIPHSAGMARLEAVFDCKVATDQARSRLRIDPSALRIPLPRANATTAQFCENHCRKLLARRLVEPSLAERVRERLLGSGLPLPNMAQMARALHMSERSLRRQLELDGTGWRRLVDEVLQAMACDLLHTSPLSVQQVAEQLGYAEPSSFSHAFKRWTGVSPEQYRRQPLSARLTTLATPAHART